MPSLGSVWTASALDGRCSTPLFLCLGAFRADCICCFAHLRLIVCSLPRRVPCGLHRQKCTRHDVQFRGMCRESVDSFSRHCINMPCADYFPVLFCCQGDLYRHCRQPWTDNRPVFLVRTAPLFHVCLGFALADTLVNSHTGWRFWDRGQVLNRLLMML